MLIALIVVLVVVAGLGLWLVSSYNGLVRARNQVQEAWNQIDVELTRRHDLIPNLVETVKGYAAHERDTLDAVIQARNAASASGASVQEQAQQEGQLSQSLGRLFAIAEAYPDLKANQNFLSLQNELSATEDRIASGRRFYNAVVRELNTKVESIPTNIIAGMFTFSRADYFEAENEQVRSAPQVSFGTSGPGVSFGGGGRQGLEPGAPAPEQRLGNTDPDYGTPNR